MVPDHGFARVGTMQVQALMPPLTLSRLKISIPRAILNSFNLWALRGRLADNFGPLGDG